MSETHEPERPRSPLLPPGQPEKVPQMPRTFWPVSLLLGLILSNMVAHYGMSHRLRPAYYEHDVEHPFLGQRIATESALSDEKQLLAPVAGGLRGRLGTAIAHLDNSGPDHSARGGDHGDP